MNKLRRLSIVLAIFSLLLLVFIFTLNPSAAAGAEVTSLGDVQTAGSADAVTSQPQRQAEPPTQDGPAKELIRRAWEKAREAGTYEFDADVSQIRRPLASVMNVGRQSERDQVYLEGVTDVDAEELEMTLWMYGGSVQDKSTAVPRFVLKANRPTRARAARTGKRSTISPAYLPPTVISWLTWWPRSMCATWATKHGPALALPASALILMVRPTPAKCGMRCKPRCSAGEICRPA